MSFQERIEKLEAELAALKAEASTSKPFALWVPKVGERFFVPDLLYCPQPKTIAVAAGEHGDVGGLAFQSEADAAEVGKYLAVVGKLCNLAKQLNKGNIMRVQYFIVGFSDTDNLEVLTFDYIEEGGCTMAPRFHSREAAETALGLLSEDEKSTLVRGIA